ncbi:MAG: type IV pilus assembly protein PilM [Bacteriovoracaceae bacterium]|nr:type IV pilus assembly protein PilM [Bacteriovoracaceae bacterium]
MPKGISLEVNKVVDDIVEMIKDSLKLGSNKVIGLDIGLSSIKACVVDKSGKNNFKLTRFATVSLPEAALIEDEIQKEEEIVEAIEKVIGRLKTKLGNVCMGMSGPNTVARKLQLAGGTNDEIAEQVSWEAEQYLPFELEESSMAFHNLGENDGGGVDVLVCAVRKDILLNFKELVENSGLKVKIVDLNVTAIINVFELVMGEKLDDPDQSWLILDLGAQKTSFIIYKGNKVQFVKEMNIGGVMITEEIQRQMGVNYEEAEDLKNNGDENGNLPEEILEIIDDVVESFFSEIKKTIDFYISSTSDESLVGCLLTGGGALVPGLIEGLEALLGVDVTVLNPFEAIEYDEKTVHEDMINDIAYRGVCAIGLGMREYR